MVLKLMKNDIKSLGKYLLFIWLGLILALISQRVLTQFISSDNEWIQLIAVNTITFMMLTVFVLFGATYIACIIHFYKSMFTGEGYLTFTLPVKPSQVVLSKILTSVLFMMVPVLITILLALSYLTDVRFWDEVVRVFQFFVDSGWTPKFLVVWGASIFVGFFGAFTELFLGMSVGQMANRNKIIYSILAIFGIRMIKQTFYSIIVVFVTLQGPIFFRNFGYDEFMIVSIIALVSTIISVVIEWTLVNYICKNKLNLE